MGSIRWSIFGAFISAVLLVAIAFQHSWRLAVGALSILATVALAWVVVWLKTVKQPGRPLVGTTVKVLRVLTYSLLALASPWTLAALLYRGPLITAVLITIVGAVALMALQVVYWRLGGKAAI